MIRIYQMFIKRSKEVFLTIGVALALIFLICIIIVSKDDKKPCSNNNNISGQKMYKRYKNNNTIKCAPKDFDNIYALNLFTRSILNNTDLAYEIANIQHPNKIVNILRELCCHFFNNNKMVVNLYPYELEFCMHIKKVMKENKIKIACRAGEVIIRELEGYLNYQYIEYLKYNIGETRAKVFFDEYKDENTKKNSIDGISMLPCRVENGKIIPVEVTETTKK